MSCFYKTSHCLSIYQATRQTQRRAKRPGKLSELGHRVNISINALLQYFQKFEWVLYQPYTQYSLLVKINKTL